MQKMRGQWIGNYDGTNSGEIILNLDETDDAYEGVAYLHESNKKLPSIAVAIKTPNKNSTSSFTSSEIYPINPKTGLIDTVENVQALLPEGFIFPKSANANFCLENAMLNITWNTDIGTTGSCELHRNLDESLSKLNALNLNWSEFKEYVSGLQGSSKLIFRGQNKAWPLRTGYHRTGRANLIRFLNTDIRLLNQKLSARTKHIFDLDSPRELGAFLNLLQHHGYPTPMLDWTYSPYVALFFAYRGISLKDSRNANPNDHVRVFTFDVGEWERDFIQILNLINVHKHVSIGEFLAIENERMIPQQAVTTVTNIDDIESYILECGVLRKKDYLKAIDIPVSERSIVIKELTYMGLQAGALFPGLDGVCEELKERNFQH